MCSQFSFFPQGHKTCTCTQTHTDTHAPPCPHLRPFSARLITLTFEGRSHSEGKWFLTRQQPLFCTANGGDISLTLFLGVSFYFSGVFCKQRMNAGVPESPCAFTSLTVSLRLLARSHRFVSYLLAVAAQPSALK